jgi:putative lipoprotein
MHACLLAAVLAFPGDRWFGADKLKHFFVSAFIQSVAYGGLSATRSGHQSSLLGATAASAAFGIGREVYDRRVKGTFSVRDLAWDAAGAGAATVMLSHARR